MQHQFRARARATLATRAGRFAGVASLGAMLTLQLGCSGTIDGIVPPGDSGATGGTSAGTSGAGGSGSGSSGTPGGGQGNGGGDAQSGGSAGGRGEDPYAVPSSAPAPAFVGTPRLSRLSRTQWSNTVRDLLKLDDISDVERDVSGDALIGFDNEADALYVTEQLRAELFDAAEKLADRVTGDAAALARLVPPDAPADLAGRARAFITSFGLQAFRRPLTEPELSDHLALFDQGPTLYPAVDAFAAGASLVIQALLQSPYFLYRTELGTQAVDGKVPLGDYEIAAKLAFAITNTMPDAELFAAAAAGQLRDPANLAARARSLIEGPHGLAGIQNLNFQIYRLGAYDGITRESETFPDFTPETPAAMRQEVLEFLGFIFSEGGGVKDFYTTPVGFVNSALAPLYGVTGTFTSDTFTKVDLDPSQRSGLLTQPGFLSSYITGVDPDIIHRGVFIATRLLCVEMPPPSPLATPLIDLQPNMTNRERVEATTGAGTCGEACHVALFNPLGYAFENYDAVGKYRTTDRGKPVNAADSYPLDDELRSFTNGVELSHLLAEVKQTHACYARNLMSYLHGRALATEEEPLVDYYARVSRAGMVSLRDLELAIVTGATFVNRLP